jgi:predicted  nucleic acid-binding Zn-ribbon protein
MCRGESRPFLRHRSQVKKNQEKTCAKSKRTHNQALQKFAGWLTARGKKLAKFPKSLIPGSSTIREICTRLGDQFQKTTKSNSALTSSVVSLLQSSSTSEQRIAQLEQRIDKLEGERTGLILGLSREVKSLRAQVNEVRKSQNTPTAQ